MTETRLPSKEASIQTLRGLAIVLMVAGHVIGSSESRGLNVENDSWWRFYYLAFADVRMPLFVLLSGYIYALRPVHSKADLHGLAKGKFRRLLVPLVTVGSLFFLVQLIVPGTNSKPEPSEFWKIFVYGAEHLWFLQAVFLIFMVVGLLDHVSCLSSFKKLSIAFMVSSLMFVLITVRDTWDVFSISGMLRLLPFFLIGIGLKRFYPQICTKTIYIAFIGLLSASWVLRIFIIVYNYSLPGLSDRLLSVILGTSAVVVLFAISQRITFGFMSWLGGYSFGIYLLHTFASAGTRIILEHSGFSDTAGMFLVCTASAIALPILFELVFGRSNIVSWGILGQKPRSFSGKKQTISRPTGE